jgi:hypothetical protein
MYFLWHETTADKAFCKSKEMAMGIIEPGQDGLAMAIDDSGIAIF